MRLNYIERNVPTPTQKSIGRAVEASGLTYLN